MKEAGDAVTGRPPAEIDGTYALLVEQLAAQRGDVLEIRGRLAHSEASVRAAVEEDLKKAMTALSRTYAKLLFRGKIVDVAPDSVIVEISGTEAKIEGFIDLMRPLGILEMVRSGRIALVRGSPPTREWTHASDGARPADAAAGAESLA